MDVRIRIWLLPNSSITSGLAALVRDSNESPIRHFRARIKFGFGLEEPRGVAGLFSEIDTETSLRSVPFSRSG